MTFDARALLLIGAFLCWILAVAVEFNAIRPDTRRRLPGAYATGLLLHGLGMMLISQRGLIADVWTILLANVLLLVAPLFYFSALQAARGLKANLKLLGAIPLSVAVLLPLAGFGPAGFVGRVVIFTAAALTAFALIGWASARLALAGHKGGGWVMFGATAVLATLTLTRAASVAAGQVSGVFDSQFVQLAFYLVNDACIVLLAFGYMDIVRARATPLETPSVLSPDAQTGLYSRAAFMRSGLEELNRARRRDYSITLMLVQIDRLDLAAAAKGAAFVERALKRVASTIQRDIRMYDIAGRLSEGVMGVLMPELALAEAIDVAERIRATVAEDPAIRNGVYSVTVSAGVCEIDKTSEDLAAALALATSYLDRAQAVGGNCVFSSASGAPKGFIQGSI